MIVKNTIGITPNDFDPKLFMWQNINHAKLLLDSLDISIGIALPIKHFSRKHIPSKWNNVDVILTNFHDWKTQNRACDGSRRIKAHIKQAKELKAIQMHITSENLIAVLLLYLYTMFVISIAVIVATIQRWY